MSALLTQQLGVICPNCDFLNAARAARCSNCQADTGAPTESATKGSGAPGPLAQAMSPAPIPADPPGLKRTSLTPAPLPTNATLPNVIPQSLKQPEKPPATTVTQPPKPAAELDQTLPPRPSAEVTVPVSPPAPSVPTQPTVPQTSPSAAAAPAAGGAPKFALNVVAGPARGQKFRVGANGAQVGRAKGVVLFPDDPFVSPLHAILQVKDGRVVIRDEGSTSGVYVSIHGQETISPDTYFAAGLRLFRYAGSLEPTPPFVPGRLVIYGAPVPPNQVHYLIEEILLGDRPGRSFVTSGPMVTVGQSKCDLSFPNDEGMGARHCELSPMPTGAHIRDLSGGLGTYLRVKGERTLKSGDRIRIGQQTLQLEAL